MTKFLEESTMSKNLEKQSGVKGNNMERIFCIKDSQAEQLKLGPWLRNHSHFNKAMDPRKQ